MKKTKSKTSINSELTVPDGPHSARPVELVDQERESSESCNLKCMGETNPTVWRGQGISYNRRSGRSESEWDKKSYFVRSMFTLIPVLVVVGPFLSSFHSHSLTHSLFSLFLLFSLSLSPSPSLSPPSASSSPSSRSPPFYPLSSSFLSASLFSSLYRGLLRLLYPRGSPHRVKDSAVTQLGKSSRLSLLLWRPSFPL